MVWMIFFNIMARLTTEEFIERARKVHGDEYDYSKVKYVNIETEVCIICNKHGEFWQTPQHHLRGHKCPKCRREERKLTQEQFIERAIKIYGNKYDYSKVKYDGIFKKICIICPEHGEFWKTPDSHLNTGSGCPKCNHKNTPYTTEEFIEKAKTIHNDKYDYSKTVYEKSSKPICIICPEHREFWQTPNNHLRGQGCPNCNGHIKLNTEEFIKRSKEVHGDKYEYSKVEYKNNLTKVCIICKEHGEFWQKPASHLSNHGCPICNTVRNSKISQLVESKLKELKIEYIKEKTFKWLLYKRNMYLDFYLPKYNIAIECQGLQHFEQIDYFGEHSLINIVDRDKLKKQLCEEHNIVLLYFNYNDDINEFEQKLKEYGIH